MTRPKRVLMFLLDGFDPGYVQPARMPRLAALMKAGASTLDGRGVLPSLTNVNHISLLTGTYPARHGLSTNFYYDRATRTDVFMEQVSFVQEPLVFEHFKRGRLVHRARHGEGEADQAPPPGPGRVRRHEDPPGGSPGGGRPPAGDLLPRHQPLGVPDGARGRAPGAPGLPLRGHDGLPPAHAGARRARHAALPRGERRGPRAAPRRVRPGRDRRRPHGGPRDEREAPLRLARCGCWRRPASRRTACRSSGTGSTRTTGTSAGRSTSTSTTRARRARRRPSWSGPPASTRWSRTPRRGAITSRPSASAT